MKMAYALPLDVGSPYTSARMPATMAIGELANTPVKKRKTSNDGQVEARAHAMVKMVKKQKVVKLRLRRP